MDRCGPDRGLDTAEADEAAAVIAALGLWLEDHRRVRASDDTNESPWIRTARLESQGIVVGPATLRGGWRL